MMTGPNNLKGETMSKHPKQDQAVKLYEDFRETSPDLYRRTVNGGGPAKYGHVVRDTWFCGYSVGNGANVHDFLYSIFSDPEQFSRRDADNIFLSLMLQDLQKHGAWSRFLNTPVVYVFWAAVRVFGGLFWKK
jgi:hypothetical protein